MPRAIPPKQQQEFDHLVALTMAFAHAEDALDPTEFCAGLSRTDYYKRILIQFRPTRTHISGLRESLNDTFEIAGDWSREKFRFVDAVLRERCSVTLDSLLGRRLARVTAVRERGRIATDEQFRLLYSRFEQIWGQQEHVGEFEALSTLMAEYEQRKARRRPTA